MEKRTKRKKRDGRWREEEEIKEIEDRPVKLSKKGAKWSNHKKRRNDQKAQG
jgi:hypothetical protein